MRQYQDFVGGLKGKGGSFLRAARKIQSAINPGSTTCDKFLWRNLFLCDQSGREPVEKHHDQLRKVSMLKEELMIFRPDVVLFMTGPRFDYTLKAVLGKDVLSAYENGIPITDIARVEIPGTKALGLRIHHPRNPRHAHWVSKAISIIASKA
jgi:hypothetical protein